MDRGSWLLGSREHGGADSVLYWVALDHNAPHLFEANDIVIQEL